MNLKSIISRAYDLYMPQVESEIERLASYIQGKISTGYTIVEIGTKFGGTFYIWNSINPEGINISIDMSDGGIHGGISEELMDSRDAIFKEWFPNCQFIRGDSHDLQTLGELIIILYETEMMVGKYEFQPSIDFLFIDGDHTYEGVKQDFEMYFQFVKIGGIIAFHDINDSERHRKRNVYVTKFWDELKEKYPYNTFTINANQDWGGIGLLIKE